MAWREETRTVTKVCWKWGFVPYPCRKTERKYCCRGRAKVIQIGLFGIKYFCCGGKEYRFIVPWLGVGKTGIFEDEVCRKSKPTPSNEECVHVVGRTPPE
jgi:hypothetical protein